MKLLPQAVTAHMAHAGPAVVHWDTQFFKAQSKDCA
jgi:hypothetical protein